MKIFNNILIIFLVILGEHSWSQDGEVLTFKEYMDIVKTGHPVAKQAGLKSEEGAMVVRKARGDFDPELRGNYNEKFYNGTGYYGLLNAGLKVPTWYGIELEGGYSQNQGTYLNPQNNLPDEGLWYGGISIPVGKGLVFDERRNSLKQAKIYRELTEVEQRKVINELLFNAGEAYWDWFKAHNKVMIYETALKAVQFRLLGVKESAALGDRPYIDTLEAGIQVQNRMLSLQQARLDYQNASALLSIYLWSDGIIPLVPDDETTPINIENISINEEDDVDINFKDSLLAVHPDLQMMKLKINQMNIDQRWKKEQLKPELNLKYNLLTRPVGTDVPYTVNPRDYLLGLEVSFPILLRSERANLKLNQLKIQENEYGLNNKRGQLLYHVNTAINSINNTADQLELYRKTVRDYARLLEGERQMFELGESSLFLVNRRELGYIRAQVQLVEIASANQKARLKMIYAMGRLGSS